ncbi:MAG: hypothetical protein CGW95_12220 [Phenylobacterium zucineum]|nr:MAG: hypothetical protein CGW95_12220 [Phenylobacterium zucineum]
MQLNPADQSLLSKYVLVAKKIIYNPERMKTFLKMMGTKEGAVTAVQTVVAAIDKLKPIPPQILPMLSVSAYMIMVDVAQEGTGHQADPAIMEEVVDQILQTAKSMAPDQDADEGQQAPGMLAQMQNQPEQDEGPGEGPGPDNTPAHENAESPALEAQEGDEEDAPGGMLAKMQRKGVPA